MESILKEIKRFLFEILINFLKKIRFFGQQERFRSFRQAGVFKFRALRGIKEGKGFKRAR
jgi:hypothetical protein